MPCSLKISSFLRYLFDLCSPQFNTNIFVWVAYWSPSLHLFCPKMEVVNCWMIKHESTDFIPHYLTSHLRSLNPNVTSVTFSSLHLGNTIWCFWILVGQLGLKLTTRSLFPWLCSYLFCFICVTGPCITLIADLVLEYRVSLVIFVLNFVLTWYHST